MNTTTIISRETIERYICSSGQEKLQKNLKYHFCQMGTYDCGPACCWMIIKWGNRFVMNDDFSYLDFIRSIGNHVEDGLWTVELLKILKDYDFRCVYCTTNIHPTPHHYFFLDFYTASDLLEETDRVQRLFETVCCSSIHICEGSVTIETIRDFLLFNTSTVILLLVDYSLLYPTRNCCVFKEFSGHYIILTEYSEHRKSFKIVDPTRYFRHYVSEKIIEKARLSKGTDEDVIFISLE